MKLWLDDIRPPCKHGCLGFEWAKTAEEAIAFLKTGKVTFASLDHDLSIKATLGDWSGERTGYDVVRWMEDSGAWPVDGVRVHSLNPAGKARMLVPIRAHYGREF